MRILFLHLNKATNHSQAGDYLLDGLMHGLMQSYEVETNINWWWLDKQIKKENPEVFSSFHGKGFTTSGILDLPPPVCLQPTQRKYDLCIVGIHHTLNNESNSTKERLIQETVTNYQAKRFAVIDGWDLPEMPRFKSSFTTYFKRELLPENAEFAKPISFAIPEEKITPLEDDFNNRKCISSMVPAMFSWANSPHVNTYKYNTEEEYYNEYKESLFAYTCKKAGWDCMRHYEILANGCIPYFTDIERCPSTTLTTLPKHLLIKLKKDDLFIPSTKRPFNPALDTYIGDTREINSDLGYCNRKEICSSWLNLRKSLYKWTKDNLTTKSLAKYVVEESL